MIKRIWFAARRQDMSPETFAAAWPDEVARATNAPPGLRPVRVAVCTTLPDLTGPDPKHDGVGIEWFTDAEHLRRFQSWLDVQEGRSPQLSLVVADESVMRGADWLERRWRDGGAKLKHMALALRASGLTPAEFSERWRNHAGTVAGTVIPDHARGRAYVQNHPYPAGERAYDALNEVYFDDTAGLRARIEWFRENLSGQADGLVRRSWFIAVREEVLHAEGHHGRPVPSD